MSVYLTKSMVRFPLLYFAMQEAAQKHQSLLPTADFPKGTRVLRAVASKFRGVPNTADTARTIFPQLQTANHRWTGAEIGAGGRGETGAVSHGGRLPGAAGLYTSLFSDALYNEIRWYSRYQTIVNPFTGADETTHWRYRRLPGGQMEVDVRPPQQLLDVLTDKQVFVYALKETIKAADFDVNSATFQSWLQRIQSERGVQAALELASLDCDYELINVVDYSTSRALGNFVLGDLGMSGLVVSTSRDDHPKTADTGKNLVLTGTIGAPLTLLQPEVSR